MREGGMEMMVGGREGSEGREERYMNEEGRE